MNEDNKYNIFYLTLRKHLKNINQIINQNLAKLGLSAQHAVYLMALSDNQNLKVKELNDVVGNDGAITTRVIQKLLNFELIAKTEESIRKCRLYLTKKGQELTHLINEMFLEVREKSMSNLTNEEFSQLEAIAMKMKLNL